MFILLWIPTELFILTFSVLQIDSDKLMCPLTINIARVEFSVQPTWATFIHRHLARDLRHCATLKGSKTLDNMESSLILTPKIIEFQGLHFQSVNKHHLLRYLGRLRGLGVGANSPKRWVKLIRIYEGTWVLSLLVQTKSTTKPYDQVNHTWINFKKPNTNKQLNQHRISKLFSLKKLQKKYFLLDKSTN
jgi:hypothetical protein